MTYLATVTSKGQVVIPAEIRKESGIDKSSKVQFIYKEGEITIKKIPDIDEMFGMFSYAAKGKKSTDVDYDRAIEEGMAEKLKGIKLSK